MKKTIILLILVIGIQVGLFSIVTEPILINQANPVLFYEQSGFQIVNNKLFITYLEKQDNSYLVKLSISTDQGLHFTSYTIDELPISNPMIPSALLVDSDENCQVFYVKNNGSSGFPVLQCAKFSAGTVISNLILAEGIDSPAQISSLGDQVFINVKSDQFKQLNYYEYITDTEKSVLSNDVLDAFIVLFNGNSESFGKVHSNSDIWLRNGKLPGTTCVNPSNPDWPWFHDKVTTTGHFRIYSSGEFPTEAQKNAIFSGGWEEEVNKEEMILPAPPESVLTPFGTEILEEQDIIKIVIDGEIANTMIGNIRELGTESFVVYSRYPDLLHPVILGDSSTYIGDSLWTNVIVKRDTIWTNGPSIQMSDQTLLIPAELWIEGQVTGKQVYHSMKDTYITGNITYSSTPIGASPDTEEVFNAIDYFGLVSDKSIYLKYKYRIRMGGETYFSNNNSQGPNGNVYLYGAYAALGKADLSLGVNSYKTEGIFSFEYQHRHGSTEPFWGISQYTGADTLYDYIDLHRYMYEPLAPNATGVPAWKKWPNLTPNNVTEGYPIGSLPSFPYYPTVDWPWLNPVWPEGAGSITWDQGTLHVFGSLAQRRRGYVHRSGIVNSSNPDMGDWDVNNWTYGPGHENTGYKKDYHYDSRLSNNPFSWFPYTKTNEYKFKNIILNSQTGDFQTQTIENPEQYENMMVTSKDDIIAMLIIPKQDPAMILRSSLDAGETYNSLNISLNMKPRSIKIEGLFVHILFEQSDSTNQLGLLSVNLTNQTQSYRAFNGNFNSLNEDIGSQLIFTTNNNHLLFCPSANHHKIYNINLDEISVVDSFSTAGISNTISGFAFQTDRSDSLYIITKANLIDPEDSEIKWNNIYLSRAFLEGITPNHDTPEPENKPFKMTCYPNPFNPEIKIMLDMPQKEEIKLDIYNIKGQKIRTIYQGNVEKGTRTFNFNAQNLRGKNLSSGIYFVRVHGPHINNIQRIILLK